MASLHVVNARTGATPEPAMLKLLCDGDIATGLTESGLDVRHCFHVAPSRPVPFRPVRPEHGHYPATLYAGPTRRERLRAWWRAHYRALFWLLTPWLSALAFYLVVCLAMDAGNALADWISARWT